MRDVAAGLCYLHEEEERASCQQRRYSPIKPRVAHCHLNPSNVFMRSDGSACIGDLGNAVVQLRHALGLTVSIPCRENSFPDPLCFGRVCTNLRSNFRYSDPDSQDLTSFCHAQPLYYLVQALPDHVSTVFVRPNFGRDANPSLEMCSSRARTTLSQWWAVHAMLRRRCCPRGWTRMKTLISC